MNDREASCESAEQYDHAESQRDKEVKIERVQTKRRNRLNRKTWSERRPPYAEPDLILSFTVHVCGGQVPES